MIQRAAVNVNLRVPLHYPVLELVDHCILLDLVLSLNCDDLRVNSFVDDTMQSLLPDHLMVNKGGEGNLDVLSDGVYVERVFVPRLLKEVRSLSPHYTLLWQVVICSSVHLHELGDRLTFRLMIAVTFLDLWQQSIL